MFEFVETSPYLSQPADVYSAQFNTFSGNDGAGEFWAVGDKMVKSCDILARSCSKGVFGGNGVLHTECSMRHVQLRPSVCHNRHDTLRR